MNDTHWHALKNQIATMLSDDLPSNILGRLSLDHVIARKVDLLPALAKLLDCECECGENMPGCEGCEWCVEEWINNLDDEDDERYARYQEREVLR